MAGRGRGSPKLLSMAAVLAPLVAGSEARAQDELDEASLEELMGIPLSAPAKVAQPVREAPSVGAVVTREQIDTWGWLTLNDVLFRQPGFAPAQDYERVTVSARGLFEGWNNNHLSMLVDGVPFNNATNGFAYTWDVVPMMLVDSVEVIRGPGSALYGTSATNGVVAVHTRPANNARPLDARVRLGNAGTQIYEAFGGYRLTPLELVAGYAYQRTAGNEYLSLDGSGRVDAAGAPQRFEVNDRHSSHYLFAKLAARGALTGLSAQVHLQAWKFQTGHGWLYVIPDEAERANNSEGRAWIRYCPPAWLDDRLQLELVAMGQRHRKDYRIKYLPSGAQLTLGGTTITYPGGVIEDIDTVAYDLFTRAQVQYRAWRDVTLLAGVENTLLAWGGDRHHAANVDLNAGGTFMPFPSGSFEPLRDSFEKLGDHPVDNLSAFAQVTTGRMFDRRVAATAGIRYDVQFFDYVDIADPARPTQHRSFDQLSPRLAAVVFPHDTLALKLLLERAFRAPSVSELLVSNSLLGNSNTENLKPEQISTVTVAVDYTPSSHLTLRGDWFYERFANQIAFSATQNLSANLYTRSLTGVELEALFDAPLRPGVTMGGFANYTLAHQLDETVQEPTITASDRLTWAPAHVANAGLSLQVGPVTVSTQGHLQGRVYRRDSDRLATGMPTAFAALRPESVAPWFRLDARVAYRPGPWGRVSVQGSNLTDSDGSLVKIGNYPFDYRIEGIRVLAVLELTANLGP
jgi:outer membrane receptor protein involved in Fe transport